MPTCEYVYCRRPFAESLEACPTCGFPRDRRRLADPGFLTATAVTGLPPAVIDMHQIIPAIEGVLDQQLAAMKLFGVRRALVQSAPPQAVSLWGNEALQELARDHGERFWVSQFVDPRHPQALDALAAIAGAGLAVVKLLPPAGYRPDDPALDEFWGAMERHGLIAMAHTGFITARHKREEAKAGVFMSSRYANPLFFDRTARKFPRLTVILCHLGGAMWYEQGAQMVTQHDNVWGDVSGFGQLALERLLKLGAHLDWSKVFWGNDSPPFAYPLNLRLHLAALAAADREDLAPRLLYDNALNFAERFLGGAAPASVTE